MTYVTDNSRSFGLPSADNVTAAEQLQRKYPRVGIQPLPEPYATGSITGLGVGINDPMENGDLKFLMIGDSGGIMDASPQRNVVNAMIGRLDSDPEIAFAYHVGDEVYFNGDANQYAPQFYEPYAHFNRPIVGVPGNHDGEVSIDDAGNATGRQPLDTFMANFCDQRPSIPECDQQFEYGRHTQTQPSHDWVLSLHALNIVGVYTNVPSGGHLEDVQVEWLTEQLRSLSKDVPLMVVLHHPPYSVDAHHGGSIHMGEALDKAATDAGVHPSIVVSGHVHNYQRFRRDTGNGQYVPYLVIGNSGYHNLHRLAKDALPGKELGTDIVFEYGDDSYWGFLQFTVSKGVVSCEYISVDASGKVNDALDKFVVGDRS